MEQTKTRRNLGRTRRKIRSRKKEGKEKDHKEDNNKDEEEINIANRKSGQGR